MKYNRLTYSSNGKILFHGYNNLLTNRLFDLENQIESGELITKEEVEAIKAENAALRERLKKAVELKAGLGDTIYMPWMWNGDCGIAALIVKEIQIIGDDVKYYVTNFTTDDLGFAAHYKFGIFSEDYFGRMVFTTIEAAESAPIT